jgi:HemY protein
VAHDHDATLLYALGVLCERESLWGKAQTYFEASLALDDHWRTHVALGELHARLGRTELANTHLAAALKRSLSALGSPSS